MLALILPERDVPYPSAKQSCGESCGNVTPVPNWRHFCRSLKWSFLLPGRMSSLLSHSHSLFSSVWKESYTSELTEPVTHHLFFPLMLLQPLLCIFMKSKLGPLPFSWDLEPLIIKIFITGGSRKWQEWPWLSRQKIRSMNHHFYLFQQPI